MEEEEANTITALKAVMSGLIMPAIAERRGGMVKTLGDGCIAEFGSVDAVRSAVALQRAVSDQNAAAPVDKRLELRIGVNLGDVVVERDDLYGDALAEFRDCFVVHGFAPGELVSKHLGL